MKKQNIILPGLFAGLIMLIANFGLGQLFHSIYPQLKAEYQNAALFRPFTDPLMIYMFIHPFIIGIILSWIWNKVHLLFKGSDLSNGFYFGLIYWLFSFPGMLISYSSFSISFLMVMDWTLGILIQSIIGSIIIVKMTRKNK